MESMYTSLVYEIGRTGGAKVEGEITSLEPRQMAGQINSLYLKAQGTFPLY